MRIAMIGTRGVPARYGGFETCVEEVGRRLVDRGHDVTVYCRRRSGDAADDLPYLGMNRVVLPAVPLKVAETLSHSAFSVAHMLRHRVDAAFVFNAANSPLLPLVRGARIPVATHVDGLEWQRDKWSGPGRRYYRVAERLAVRWSDALIADADGIADYYRDEFRAETVRISYGAPKIEPRSDRLAEVGLAPGGYHLVVARFEPENHVRMVVRGYVAGSARLPLVVVGSAPYAHGYTRSARAAADERVRFLGAIWDQDLLDQLYANAATYVHGHSVGGTNPSLLRAMGAGAPVIAFDVGFNREVVREAGWYFDSPESLRGLFERAESDPRANAARGRLSLVQAARYDWDAVAIEYEKLATDLAAYLATGTRPSGRRTGVRA